MPDIRVNLRGAAFAVHSNLSDNWASRIGSWPLCPRRGCRDWAGLGCAVSRTEVGQA